MNESQKNKWGDEFDRLFVIDVAGNKKYKAIIPNSQEDIKSFITNLLAHQETLVRTQVERETLEWVLREMSKQGYAVAHNLVNDRLEALDKLTPSPNKRVK